MSDEAPESFDLDRLQKLVELMEKHDLREVKLKRGNQKWVLRRGPQEVLQMAPATGMVSMPMTAPATAHAPAAPAAVASAAASGGDGLQEIKSPMVGTFYRSPSPGEPPFVKEGDRVGRDSVVCLVEAMKFFNQIKAELSGTIVKVLVNDGDPVDYGQALFKVKPE
jgi:acetyl-CoA carboxylase biotin carboxyl carrier protein